MKKTRYRWQCTECGERLDSPDLALFCPGCGATWIHLEPVVSLRRICASGKFRRYKGFVDWTWHANDALARRAWERPGVKEVCGVG